MEIDEQNFKLDEAANKQKLEFCKHLDEIELESRKQWMLMDSNHWKKINDSYFKLISSAQTAFETNRIINIVIVSVGIVIFGYALLYSWVNEINAWSFFTGGAGVAFIAKYFIKPQEGINRAIGNLAQIQMVFKAHAAEWEFLKIFGLKKIDSEGPLKPLDVKDAKEILVLYKDLEKMTENSVKMIQDYVETEKTTGASEENKDSTSKTAV